MVKNVNETLEYYTSVLGFKLLDTNPATGTFEWGYVTKGNVGLMFQEEKSLKKEYPDLENLQPGAALTFYIRIPNIKEFYDSIRTRVNIIKPVNETFYGTMEFAMTDVNGFILTFSETPEQ